MHQHRGIVVDAHVQEHVCPLRDAVSGSERAYKLAPCQLSGTSHTFGLRCGGGVSEHLAE